MKNSPRAVPKALLKKMARGGFFAALSIFLDADPANAGEGRDLLVAFGFSDEEIAEVASDLLNITDLDNLDSVGSKDFFALVRALEERERERARESNE